jgi:hypothetical protein
MSQVYEMTDMEDELIAALISKANANLALMDGTTAPVISILAAADVVLAVWPDKSKPFGVDTLILKGTRKLLEIIAGAESRERVLDAVMCSCAEQAIATADVLGESDPRH